MRHHHIRGFSLAVGAIAALALGACAEGTSPLAPSDASLHAAPPCNDSGEPGNSDYAQHHIRPLATSGGLGEGGHKPGAHRGYSVCL